MGEEGPWSQPPQLHHNGNANQEQSKELNRSMNSNRNPLNEEEGKDEEKEPLEN